MSCLWSWNLPLIQGSEVCSYSLMCHWEIMWQAYVAMKSLDLSLHSTQATRIFVIETYQVWVLAPDIGQCPAKNLVMSDESCFTTDTIFRLGVKYFFYNLTNTKDVFKTSSSRRMFGGELFKQRDSNAGVFLRILPNFQEHLLW